VSICEIHWDMVYENVIRAWVQRGVFVKVRRLGPGEVCKCCEELIELEIAQTVGLAEKWPLRMDGGRRNGKEQEYATPALLGN